MRKAQAEQEGRRWLKQGRADLAAAKWNEKGGFYSVACFWSQQTAAGALKVYLYFRGKRHVVGHSVLELSKDCASLGPEFGPLGSEISILDRLYTPTRYPNGLPGGIPAQAYTADEARAALRLAEKTVETVEEKMSSGFSQTT